MAVAFSSIVNVTPGTGTNTGASPSITSPATNPVMIVCIGLNSATATVSSLTITGFGGTATEVKTQRDTSFNAYVSVWRIVAPTANTAGTVQGNLSASVPFQMAVAGYSGADQSDPVPAGDAVSDQFSPHPHTLTPTNLVSGDASAGAVANSGAQDLSNCTPNNRFINNTTAVNFAVGDATDTTGVTFDNTADQNIPQVAVRIVQGAAAPQDRRAFGVIGGGGTLNIMPIAY